MSGRSSLCSERSCGDKPYGDMSHGFTLIEVVVALSLLSLLMLIAMTAFRGLGQTANRLDGLATQNDELRIVSAFLRHTVGAARAIAAESGDLSAIGATTGSASFAAATHFRGDPQALSWVSILPARDGVGGLSTLNLTLSENAGEGRLILGFAPFDPTRPTADRNRYTERVLIDRVAELAILYRAAGETEWASHWHDRSDLPGHVKITLMREHGHWPPLIIAIAAGGAAR